MLIQNISNMAPAIQPAKLAGDSSAVAVTASSPNPETVPGAPADKSLSAAKQVAGSQPPTQPTTEQLKSVVDGINKVLKQANRSLEFSVDKDTNKQVVKLMDSESGEVIRQFPTDEMLAISRAIDHVQQGLFLKQKA